MSPQVEAKPVKATCVGLVAGLSLLLFAGAIFAAAPQLDQAAHDHDDRDDVVSGGGGVGVVHGFLAGRRLAVNDTLKAFTENTLKATTLSVAAEIGAITVTLAANPGFEAGQRVVIDAGLITQEANRIHAALPDAAPFVVTLKDRLAFKHAAGAPIVTKEETLSEMSMHQSSSGSLDSFKSSSSSSIGTSVDSSGDSSASSSGKSFAGDAWKTGSTGYGASSCGSLIFQLLIMICYGFIYKQKVVDPMGSMPPQPPQYDRGYDDFPFGICDCIKDVNYCCMVACCPIVRVAHTNAITGVCGFWETILCMWCSTFLCGCGPCCLNVYFRIHIKDHMGIEDHCFNDMILAWCCFPCITGQQAMSADDALGWKFKCPCTSERIGYGGAEGQPLNYS